jgi:HAD superfamily hydrolase (TIGR01459 family)
MSTPLIPGLGAVAEEYDGFIFDVWGVLYDGGEAFPGVVACLEALRQRKKRIVVLSNSPRRAETVVGRLMRIGIGPDLYDAVHTSGEETHRHLLRRPDAFYRSLGPRFVDTGDVEAGDISIGTGAARVDDVAEADFVLATMAKKHANDLHHYDQFLATARAKDLPMICANPDLTVIHGGRIQLCGGGIAEAYRREGGTVRYHGKPDPAIYATCFALLGLPDKRRILAIGDGLLTDIPGAKAAGIASLLVLAGLPSLELGPEPEAAAIEALCRAHNQEPRAAIQTVRW